MSVSLESSQANSNFSSPEADVYQSVSRAAVASAILGLFGFSAFPFLPLLILSIVGAVFAAIAFRAFKQFPNEILGKPLAMIGAVLCTIVLVFAPSYHIYVYLTEVPDGYERVDFALLLSPTGREDRPTDFALTLDDKKVFIKGYIHPTSMDSLISKRFVLVPDLGTCCFGGQPPLTHMIEVSLSGEQYAQKSYRKQRLAGTLQVNQYLKKIDGLEGVYYQLRADILK